MYDALVEWAPFLITATAAYYLPGSALLTLLAPRGVSKSSRAILAVAFSLVIVPFGLAAVGAVRPLTPTLVWPLAIAAGLYIPAFAMRNWRSGRSSPAISEVYERGSARESTLVLLGILVLALIFNLSRLDMFLAGVGTIQLGPSDVYWQLQELVSVARTGIPPRHFLFPDLDLAHYYWSWIYPAAVANSPYGDVSLARELSLHSFVQTAAFLGVVYVFARRALRSALGRVFAVAFVSLFGGFDGFVSRWRIERWPEVVPWLEGYSEISQFATLLIWVPHHVAGAMTFLMGLILWRYMRLSWWVKAILFGVLAGFIFGTSPWVFLGSAIFAVIWLLGRGRIAILRLNRVVATAAIAGGVFAMGSWSQILLSASRESRFEASSIRVPLLERLISEDAVYQQIDHWLTVMGFPAFLSWLLVIEIGLPFILYLYWVFREWGGRTSWHRATRLFPLVYLLLVLLVRDTAPGLDGISLRGVIPVQVIVALGGAYGLDRLWGSMRRRASRWMLAYALLIFFLAQVPSAMLALFQVAPRPVMNALGISSVSFVGPDGLRIERVDRSAKPGFPDRFVYIHWLHENTDADAIVIEDLDPAVVEPLTDDFELRWRLLERLRYIEITQASHLQTGGWADLILASASSIDELMGEQQGKDVLEAWRNSDWSAAGRPTYFVSWTGPRPSLGRPVYEDDFVLIYHLEE